MIVDLGLNIELEKAVMNNRSVRDLSIIFNYTITLVNGSRMSSAIRQDLYNGFSYKRLYKAIENKELDWINKNKL
jgi:hypothetical protein